MKFLVVEDQDAMRTALGAFLQARFPRAHILEAASVAQALELCREHDPQLAVVDVLLPDGNGIELTRRLKARHPQVPVIVVSYLSGQSYVDGAREAGAHVYLHKDRLHADLNWAAADALACAGHRVRD